MNDNQYHLNHEITASTNKVVSKIISFLSIIFIFLQAGCSFLSKDTYYQAQYSKGWEKTEYRGAELYIGETKFATYSYKCDGFTMYVRSSISIEQLSIGPPFLPFIPWEWKYDNNDLTIDISYSPLSPNNNILLCETKMFVNTDKYIEPTRLSCQPGYKNTTDCKYSYNNFFITTVPTLIE